MHREPVLGEGTATGEPCFKVVILSAVRFLREAVAEFIGRHQGFSISALAGDLDEALAVSRERPPDIVLLDASLPDGPAAVGQIRDSLPEASVILLAVAEADETIVAWAEAGVAGYIPSAAAPGDLAPFLAAIMRGEQPCSERAAACLLRRVASLQRASAARTAVSAGPTLTARERQIVQLIDAGFSNKEIARRLNIEVATTKSHVHNLLGKLDLQRRGQVTQWMRAHERQSGLPRPARMV